MKFIAEVKVALKPGVVDAEGETVEKNLRLLGYEQVEKVETVKVYRISVESKSKGKVEREMEDACKKLLANPVIQKYEIKIKKK